MLPCVYTRLAEKSKQSLVFQWEPGALDWAVLPANKDGAHENDDKSTVQSHKQ